MLHALDAITADLASVESPEQWARVIEHMRAAMATAGFDLSQIGARPAPSSKGDTTYIAVVDHDGAGASLITSLFGDFGSHFGVPALGGAIGTLAVGPEIEQALTRGEGEYAHLLEIARACEAADPQQVLHAATRLQLEPASAAAAHAEALNWTFQLQDA